jgi:excisionase family DNA binding protein
MDDRYLSVRQLAEYTSLSEGTIRTILPEIPHHRLKRKILIKRSEFDRWLLRRRQQKQHVSPLVKDLVEKIKKDIHGN